jgi:O-6-methylguanine DNA methyltransferase
VPLDLRGSPFHRRVWRALTSIPYGRTVSYGSIARDLGLPKAARAVGAACGANPVPLVAP